jgi:predicted HTH transcriptional regulator
MRRLGLTTSVSRTPQPVSESRDIEYKRDTYGNADKDHGEYLADISSFGNTAGGEIIIGMTEQAGVPTGFSPLQIDADKEVLRLQNIALSGMQPRIFGLAVHAVPIAGGGSVLVVRIPRSYNLPHRIVRQGSGHHRFFCEIIGRKIRTQRR